MLEDKIARKLADMFSDSRINVFVLAAMTRRYMNPHVNRVLEEWWDLHRADASTYLDSNQMRMAFDVDTYNVS